MITYIDTQEIFIIIKKLENQYLIKKLMLLSDQNQQKDHQFTYTTFKELIKIILDLGHMKENERLTKGNIEKLFIF